MFLKIKSYSILRIITPQKKSTAMIYSYLVSPCISLSIFVVQHFPLKPQEKPKKKKTKKQILLFRRWGRYICMYVGFLEEILEWAGWVKGSGVSLGYMLVITIQRGNSVKTRVQGNRLLS